MRGRHRTAVLAACLALAACSSSLGADVPGNTHAVTVPSPALGHVKVALLRFYLAPGEGPDLRIANGYRQPATAAFVGGIAHVGAGNTRFVGLVVIANFANPAGATSHKGAAAIQASQPFFVDYLGDLQSVGTQASAIQAILTGIPGPEAWQVDWFNQPEVETVAARSFTADGRSLLDATFRRLLGRPNSGYVEAVAGPPTPKPSKSSQVAAAKASAKPSAAPSPNPSGARSTVPVAPSTAPRATGTPSPEATVTAPVIGMTAPVSGGTANPVPQPSPTPSPTGGPAPAPLSVEILSTSEDGPYAAGAHVTAVTGCPDGSTLVGGGFQLHTISGANPNNSFRDLGEYPSATDGSPVASGPAQTYATLGGAGGQAMKTPPDPQAPITTNFAFCATGWPGAVEVVSNATFQQILSPATTTPPVIATCPSGTTLIGGGAYTSVPPPPALAQPSLHLIGDYPTDASGASPASGARTTSWGAVAAAGGNAVIKVTTAAYAVCAHAGPPVAVAAATVPGPEVASSPTVATATCPAGTVLLDGGVRTDLAGGATPQQGVHLNGSFAGAAGVVVDGGAPGQSWSGVTHAGGQAAPNTETLAFAMCATR